MNDDLDKLKDAAFGGLLFDRRAGRQAFYGNRRAVLRRFDPRSRHYEVREERNAR